MRDVLTMVGILFVVFVIVPWSLMAIVKAIRAFLDDNDKFDG